MKNAHKFALVLFFSVLVLTACSPQTATIQTSRPTAPSNTPAPPTAAAISEPSPTATDTSPQLEVVEWYRWSEPAAFEGDIPNTYVEILIRNPYDFPVNVYEPAVQFLNAGEVVMRTRDIDLYMYADAGWNMILPGETVPGRIIAWPNRFVTEIPEWDTFTITADLEEATQIPYTTDLDISTGSFTYGDNGFFSAKGIVTNTSGQPLKTILLRVIARNASGGFVGSGLIGVIGDFVDGEYQSLDPGSAYEFTLSAFVDPSMSDVLNFEVSGFGITAE